MKSSGTKSSVHITNSLFVWFRAEDHIFGLWYCGCLISLDCWSLLVDSGKRWWWGSNENSSMDQNTWSKIWHLTQTLCSRWISESVWGRCGLADGTVGFWNSAKPRVCGVQSGNKWGSGTDNHSHQSELESVHEVSRRLSGCQADIPPSTMSCVFVCVCSVQQRGTRRSTDLPTEAIKELLSCWQMHAAAEYSDLVLLRRTDGNYIKLMLWNPDLNSPVKEDRFVHSIDEIKFQQTVVIKSKLCFSA